MKMKSHGTPFSIIIVVIQHEESPSEADLLQQNPGEGSIEAILFF